MSSVQRAPPPNFPPLRFLLCAAGLSRQCRAAQPGYLHDSHILRPGYYCETSTKSNEMRRRYPPFLHQNLENIHDQLLLSFSRPARGTGVFILRALFGQADRTDIANRWVLEMCFYSRGILVQVKSALPDEAEYSRCKSTRGISSSSSSFNKVYSHYPSNVSVQRNGGDPSLIVQPVITGDVCVLRVFFTSSSDGSGCRPPPLLPFHLCLILLSVISAPTPI